FCNKIEVLLAENPLNHSQKIFQQCIDPVMEKFIAKRNAKQANQNVKNLSEEEAYLLKILEDLTVAKNDFKPSSRVTVNC
ncbi:MAG: hypothetical protein AAGG80_02220, partial [Pseudomonadota bacterium]